MGLLPTGLAHLSTNLNQTVGIFYNLLLSVHVSQVSIDISFWHTGQLVLACRLQKTLGGEGRVSSHSSVVVLFSAGVVPGLGVGKVK